MERPPPSHFSAWNLRGDVRRWILTYGRSNPFILLSRMLRVGTTSRARHTCELARRAPRCQRQSGSEVTGAAHGPSTGSPEMLSVDNPYPPQALSASLKIQLDEKHQQSQGSFCPVRAMAVGGVQVRSVSPGWRRDYYEFLAPPNRMSRRGCLGRVSGGQTDALQASRVCCFLLRSSSSVGTSDGIHGLERCSPRPWPWRTHMKAEGGIGHTSDS
ncbi:hypothetical protein R3P38DRAFT_619040 [Favolaschia claudopus]|uniref:Uncharacterized protein n=1 Tax=Favolaschia claudopus TaxID=2862362 RepID=A0AAW0CDY6_9AGAR